MIFERTLIYSLHAPYSIYILQDGSRHVVGPGSRSDDPPGHTCFFMLDIPANCLKSREVLEEPRAASTPKEPRLRRSSKDYEGLLGSLGVRFGRIG